MNDRRPRRRTVFCTLQFEGFHRWPEAPPTQEYLFHLHRHMFHVRVDVDIEEDREVEFIDLKAAVQRFIRETQEGPLREELETWSCERWGLEILDRFAPHGAFKVEVSEDGENGAVVYL